MHNFSELIFGSTTFTLDSLKEVEDKIVKPPQISGSTILVKNLQMIELQKTITAIGMFSLFESILQDRLNCNNGFEEAKKILIQSGNEKINKRFVIFICAINVLKHGKGRSYNTLVAESEILPFKIKFPGENYFEEGDASEMSTLIDVNNDFILMCAKLIEEVSEAICKVRQDIFI
ncbi:hypothetical protein [Aequorivita sediminis]|uniref:hypothetical protein n=1 Tax=Aequorivita sediminis TaxID=3073653 RepID=UPI0028AE2D65|nr:hypothetical protein [Aequorivita sp. F6058]